MKNLIFAFGIILFFNSCISTKTIIPQNSGIENLKREDYTLLPEKREETFNMRFWLLFLPIGGKNNKVRESKCYQRMLLNNKADGVISQKYTHNKVTISLLAISLQSFNTTMTGRPYVLKADSLKQK